MTRTASVVLNPLAGVRALQSPGLGEADMHTRSTCTECLGMHDEISVQSRHVQHSGRHVTFCYRRPGRASFDHVARRAGPSPMKMLACKTAAYRTMQWSHALDCARDQNRCMRRGPIWISWTSLVSTHRFHRRKRSIALSRVSTHMSPIKHPWEWLSDSSDYTLCWC